MAAALVLVASQFAPAVAAPTSFTAAPSRSELVVGGLGRRHAAADLVWVRVVQHLGDARYANARYPGLEEWLDVLGELNPRLEAPFYFGAIVLIADPARRDRVDELLAMAEQRVPNDFRFPLQRGLIAYFGRFDSEAAAEAIERAAAKPNAPEFLQGFARTLRTRGVECAAIAADAANLARAPVVLEDRTIACLKRRIEAAAAAARLNGDAADTVDALVEHGHLRANEIPTGVCWALEGGAASAISCPQVQK